MPLAKFLLQAGESAMLNMFLQEFKEKIINQRGHEFWLLLVKGRHCNLWKGMTKQ